MLSLVAAPHGVLSRLLLLLQGAYQQLLYELRIAVTSNNVTCLGLKQCDLIGLAIVSGAQVALCTPSLRQGPM